MSTFAEEVGTHLEEYKDGFYRMKMTDEQREFFNRKETAETVELTESQFGATVSTMQIAQALEEAHLGRSQTAKGIFADVCVVTGITGKKIEIPCAACKASNMATGNIQQATVNKLYCEERLTDNNSVITLKAAIRSTPGPVFAKQEERKMEHIIKEFTAHDFQLGATVFPQDIRQVDELNECISMSHNLKMQMLATVLESLRGANDDTLLAAFRNMNRSMAEQLFLAAFSMTFGTLNEGDAVQVKRFNELRRSFFSNVNTIGSTFLTPQTINFGINVRKMTIAETVVWSNARKLNRVKQLTNSSFYVSTGMDTGLSTIPTTSEIVAKYAAEIDKLVHYTGYVIENEVRLQCGLKALALPEKPAIKLYTGSTSYAELLGISVGKQGDILSNLQAKLRDLAMKVCENRLTADSVQSIEAVNEKF